MVLACLSCALLRTAHQLAAVSAANAVQYAQQQKVTQQQPTSFSEIMDVIEQPSGVPEVCMLPPVNSSSSGLRCSRLAALVWLGMSSLIEAQASCSAVCVPATPTQKHIEGTCVEGVCP